MDQEKLEELKRLRRCLGISEPSEGYLSAWLACAKTGDLLMRAWIEEQPLAPLYLDELDQVLLGLAKSDFGPDGAMYFIHRTLDVDSAWNAELLLPVKLLEKAAHLRGKHTQKRWVLTLQRVAAFDSKVDSSTREIALRGLLQTDKVENVECLVNKRFSFPDYGLRLRHLKSLNLSKDILEFVFMHSPEFKYEKLQNT